MAVDCGVSFYFVQVTRTRACNLIINSHTAIGVLKIVTLQISAVKSVITNRRDIKARLHRFEIYKEVTPPWRMRHTLV